MGYMKQLAIERMNETLFERLMRILRLFGRGRGA